MVNNRKGKTYEEIYGIERANEERQKRKLGVKNNLPKTSFKKGHGMNQGINHPNWRGGKKVFYHNQSRKIMESYLKRKLEIGEYIHHLDFNWKNNYINNLYLLNTLGEHRKYHIFLQNCVKEIINEVS